VLNPETAIVVSGFFRIFAAQNNKKQQLKTT
jgi:hypothetical protein